MTPERWTLESAVWELLWAFVAIGIGYLVALRWGNTIVARAAEKQHATEWQQVGRRARETFIELIIQFVAMGLASGLPVRTSSLAASALRSWADHIRAVLVRRPHPATPLTMQEIRGDDDVRVIGLLHLAIPRWRVPAGRLIRLAAALTESLPNAVRRPLTAACLELDHLMVTVRPLNQEMTEDAFRYQATQNANAAVTAFEAIAELADALNKALTKEEKAERDEYYRTHPTGPRYD